LFVCCVVGVGGVCFGWCGGGGVVGVVGGGGGGGGGGVA